MPFSRTGIIFQDTNIFRGITPVSSIFTTVPTTLENTTDGDVSTGTGEGSKVMAGAGNYGILTWDLGSVMTILCGARIGLYSTAGSAFAFFESSPDNVNWTATGIEDSVCMAANAAEQISDSLTAMLTGRYIRLRFYITAAATAKAKVYEVYGFKRAV